MPPRQHKISPNNTIRNHPISCGYSLGGGSDQPCVGRKREDKRKEGFFPAANVPPLILVETMQA